MNEIPHYKSFEFSPKRSKYCVIIHVINEGDRIKNQLLRMRNCAYDIIISDGGSTDGATSQESMKDLGINTLLITQCGFGIQMRASFDFALNRGYLGIITIDGNNKDSVENIQDFADKLDAGYGFIQGSRFMSGGHHKNTPKYRLWAIKCIHVPLSRLSSKFRFTDSTNGFRAYSAKYLCDTRLDIFRDIFQTYDIQFYMTIKASRLGYKVCEIPVTRIYPKHGKIPTKVSLFGNFSVLWRFIKVLIGRYNPKRKKLES